MTTQFFSCFSDKKLEVGKRLDLLSHCQNKKSFSNSFFLSFGKFVFCFTNLLHLLQSLSNIDKALVLRVAEGDECAFRILSDQYRNKIFSIAWKITGVKSAAEDVVQEVFMKLWMNKEKLAEVENFNAYINTIIRNHILNNLRKVAYEQTFLEDLIKQQSVNTKNVSDPVLYRELQNLVHKAIQRLSPQQKKIFQLSRTEGLKHAEIASKLNISQSTVKDHLVEALRSIKAFLNANKSLISLLFLFHACSSLFILDSV